MPEGPVRPLVWYCAPHTVQTVGNEEQLSAIQKFGDMSIICSRYGERLKLPEAVANGLGASKSTDVLLLCDDQYLDALCISVWFAQHPRLTLLVHEHYGYACYDIDKNSIMRLVQRRHDALSKT